MAFDNPTAPVSAADSKLRLRLISAAYARTPNQLFRAIPDIDNTALDALCATPTDGTILEPAVKALNDAGIPTKPNLGSLMETLGIDADDVHDLACECHGGQVAGCFMAARFEYEATQIAD